MSYISLVLSDEFALMIFARVATLINPLRYK